MAPSRSSHRIRVSLSVLAAVLCVGVALIHIDDQGGLTAFDDPDWMGWGYRLLEVSSVVVALALLALPKRLPVPCWLAAFLIGIGPLSGFLLTRTVGLPGDHDDIGNWGPLGVSSLFVEGTLILVALFMLRGELPSRAPSTTATPA